MTSVKGKAASQGASAGSTGKATKDDARKFMAHAAQPSGKSQAPAARKDPPGPKAQAARLDAQVRSGAPVREQLKTLAANPLTSRLADTANAAAHVRAVFWVLPIQRTGRLQIPIRPLFRSGSMPCRSVNALPNTT